MGERAACNHLPFFKAHRYRRPDWCTLHAFRYTSNPRYVAITDRRQTLATIERQLRAKMNSIEAPKDDVRMAQAYEAYSEIGTGAWNRTTQREEAGLSAPAYLWTSLFRGEGARDSRALPRHREIAHEALEAAAELAGGARKPEIHFGS
jgi:hypothetical protein